MAMELFELKTKFDEQEQELQWSKTEAEARERDFKVYFEVGCMGSQQSSKTNAVPFVVCACVQHIAFRLSINSRPTFLSPLLLADL